MSTQITQTNKFWNTGDTITADKLTQMGVLARATEDENHDFTLDMTWQEVVDNMVTEVVIDSEEEGVAVRDYYIVLEVIADSGQNNYIIIMQTSGGGGATRNFRCSSPNGYPTTKQEEGGESITK